MTASDARPKLQELPDEILLRILTYLEPHDFPGLQGSCRRIRKISLDNNHWKVRTFDQTPFLENIERKRRLSQYVGDGIFGSNDPGECDPDVTEDLTYPYAGMREARKKQRYMDNWDPTYPGESVMWFNEYVQRYAPATTNWLQQPFIRDGAAEDRLDALGVALYHPPSEPGSMVAVSPLDDGSICLWDVKGRNGRRKGATMAKSQAGILHIKGSGRTSKMDTNVVENIAVDSQRGKAFVAVQGHLREVDLATLQVVSDQAFEWSIKTLSAATPDVPLTVGTSLGVHLYDYRARDNRRVVDKIFDADLPAYSPLAQPHPLSILHLPNAGNNTSMSNDIYIAGRFASILHYDRRRIGNSSPVVGHLHSGARLSSMTYLPCSFSPLDSEVRRRGELSADQVRHSKEKEGRTLIACGEYKGKGSLELYGLPATSANLQPGREHHSPHKNRQTAASAGLLSVVNHGTRIVFSDRQGYIKWFERDGTTEVRRHKIGHIEVTNKPSLFSRMAGAGDMACKMLSTRAPDDSNTDERLNDDDVLFWTGERLGLVSFTGKPGSRPEDFEDRPPMSETMQRLEREADEYEEKMRAALERQADDVRLVRHLGMGTA
ncbi:F-box domain-containing protein [Plectosphaerella plurivora]|uniref:F-box domain-containing protein n=1 Tax=Plectosphaerella plurivora TaxID=936078 RepID=A0A9P8V8I5_9PEZI|nr:F-box domain-containing protein [Plectosphaerella plurivora]